MVQAIDSTIATNFLTDAVVERHNFSQLNKTRIRFRIQLKKSTKSAAPKWADVLKAEVSEIESDLVKVTNSEVGLRGIKVFKKLDEAAAQLRQEIASVQEWMSADAGDWVCPIDLAPLVWNQLINIRDNVAPSLRNQLKVDYESGLVDYQERIDQFLSLHTWELPHDKQADVKANLLRAFPTLTDLEDYLQVVIGRPVIIPALSEQLDQKQAECLDQITKFIQQYDQNLEQRLRESALAGGEQLAAQLLEELADWEPGRKPIQFKKKMQRHLMKVQVLLANADPDASSSLEAMMAHLEDVCQVKKSSSNDILSVDKNATALQEPCLNHIQVTLPENSGNYYQLLSAGVTGITINPTTGLLTWNNPVAGNYKIVVGAVDAAGLGAAQGFTLTARVNNAPVIRSTPVLTATPGSTYSYDVIASDVDGDRLSYTLDLASRDLGMTLDTLGRLRWTPTAGNVGTHHVVLTASDGIVSSPQEYNLVVAADMEAPKVRLIANYDSINLGESITFQARATDNTKVAGLQLLIDNTPIVLDSNGMVTFTPTIAGTIIAKAIAKDTAGNPGEAIFNVAVLDPSDVNAPDVSLNLDAYANGTVTGPIKIKGTVNDDNLDYYVLLVAPIGSSDFKEIFRGTSTVNNDVLGRFDPSLLENDSYTLRLEAHDKGGNVSFVEDTVNGT